MLKNEQPSLFQLPLVGSKIGLRKFLESDLTSTYLSWLNDQRVVRYSNQRFTKHTYESCLHYLSSFANSCNHFFAIYELETGVVVGTLTIYQNKAHGTADIGILVGNPAYWGKGIGSDAFRVATQALINCGSVRKITAGTVSENKAMIRVIESAGLKLEAVRRGQEMLEERAVDLLYFSRFCDA